MSFVSFRHENDEGHTGTIKSETCARRRIEVPQNPALYNRLFGNRDVHFSIFGPGRLVSSRSIHFAARCGDDVA